MTPDNADCEHVVRGSSRTRNSSPTHKHRRGKTGRARKKRRHWGFFSRWKTSESDDDDDLEMYRWSKSRGLTARALPPSPPQPATTVAPSQPIRIRGYSDHVETKSAVDRRSNPSKQMRRSASADAIASMQEAIFLTKLCSSITDKKSFVYRSKSVNEIEEKPKKAPEKSAYQVAMKQVSKVVNPSQIPAHKAKVKEEKEGAEPPKRSSSLPNIDNSIGKSADDEKNVTNKDETTSIKKRESSAHSKRPSTLTEDSTSSTTSAGNVTSKKEWSASVENDILRLYESVSPAAPSSNLVYSWSRPTVAMAGSPTQQSDISHTVDQKIERAEHTPSYVQMLAKMLKSGVQMRKEREDRVEENLKRNKLNVDCLGNESTSLKSESALQSASSRASIMESNPISKAHLRYRHLADSTYNLGRFFRTTEETSQQDQLHISHTIRIDPLDVGYTHGRYSKVLKCNQEGRYRQPKNMKTQPTSKEKGLESHAADTGQSVNNPSEECLVADFDSHFPFLKFNNINKQQKPTPNVNSCLEAKYNSRSTLLVAKTTSRCPKPNLRNDFGDAVNGTSDQKLSPPKLTSTSATNSNSLIAKDTQVRWSTSIGSLYCRPPGRIIAKAPAQRA